MIQSLGLWFKSYKRMLLGGTLLLGFLTSYWVWLDYRDFLKTPIQFKSTSQVFTVEPGTGINKLANKLQAMGVVTQTIYFKLLAYQYPELTKLKVGEYRLDKALTPKQLLTLFNSGKVIQYAFTIIEGQTYWQVLENLDKETRLIPLTEQQHENLPGLLNLSTQLKPLNKTGLKESITSIEGWLLPETYYYGKGEKALDILLRASSAMKQQLEQAWLNREPGLPYENPYQVLIMASIIEKETGIASERPEIAGVFVRRLQKKMRLQTDPTVIYGIGPNFNGDITRKDLKTPTPYNTYVIKGLPPTPIAMPSKEAILAAVNPADGNTLYFVADGTGGHYFSETLAEHQRAVMRMLKRNRQSKNK